MTESLLVHICERLDWEQAQRMGIYRPESLGKEGFIHASRPEQVLVVANRFFHSTQDLLALWIDPQKVNAPIFDEAADGDVFPHIYGALNLDAVSRAVDLAADADGVFRKLPGA